MRGLVQFPLADMPQRGIEPLLYDMSRQFWVITMKRYKPSYYFQKPDPDFSPSLPPVRAPEQQPAVPPAGQPPGKEANDEELPVPPIFPTA